MVSAAVTASLPAWLNSASLASKTTLAEPPEDGGKLGLELVRHLLGFGARDLEVVGQGAVEGGGRTADRHHHCEPQGDDEPAVAVGELAEAVEHQGHVSADLGKGWRWSWPGWLLPEAASGRANPEPSRPMESIRSWRRMDRDSGGEGSAAPEEPDVHGGFAAGDDGTGQGAEVQLVELDAVAEALAGRGNDLDGAVVPGFQLGPAELRIGLAQAVQLGQRSHRHGVCELHEGCPGRFQEGFPGRAQPELLECLVQEAEGDGGNGRLGAAEVVEEGAAGDAGGVGDVLDREVAGAVGPEQRQGGVGDGLAGGRFVQFAARRLPSGRTPLRGALGDGEAGTRTYTTCIVCTPGNFLDRISGVANLHRKMKGSEQLPLKGPRRDWNHVLEETTTNRSRGTGCRPGDSTCHVPRE